MHTKEPWEVMKAPAGGFRITPKGKVLYIASLLARPLWVSEEETSDNAFLISAAPELLDALINVERLTRELLSCVDDKGYLETSVNVERIQKHLLDAQSAIRKAKGEI